MNFDYPFLNPEPNHSIAYPRVGMQNLGVDANDGYTGIHVYGQITGEGLYIRIRSKWPLFATISGVAGKADPNSLQYKILSPADF
jgi:hypothetical protein